MIGASQLATAVAAAADDGLDVIGLLVMALPSLPLLLAAWFGLAAAVGIRLRERTIVRATLGGAATAAIASLVVLVHALQRAQPLRVVMVHWLWVPKHGIDVAFWLDPLSAVMAAMTCTLGFVVAWFSVAYLHREPGFQRYFMLVNLFLAGMQVLALGDGFMLLFLGWEWVGLCSALLIGFFHERAAPVRAGARAFITNRFGDFGLLTASLFAAHEFGGDGWAAMNAGAVHLSPTTATVIGLALWLAAMSKSAQLPFSSWMAHAVEGPTTSTGLFYGAVMAHAGVYLMMRTGPIVQHSTITLAAMVVVGGLTLVYAAAVGAAQPDAKGSIVYSTIAQLGGMFAACGLGAWHLVVILMVLHAGLRAVQFLFAPSVIRQVRAAQHAAALDATPTQGRMVHSGLVGLALVVAAWGAFGLSNRRWWYGPTGSVGLLGADGDLALMIAALASLLAVAYVGVRRPERRRPEGLAARLHERALHRFDLDAFQEAVAVRPLLALGGALKRLDDRWRDRARALAVAGLVVAAFMSFDPVDVEAGHVVVAELGGAAQGGTPWLSMIWLLPLVTAVLVWRIHDDEWARVFARGGAAFTLALAIAIIRRFEPGDSGMQFVERLPHELLGLGYHVGVDGISVVLVLLQALLVMLLLVALGRRTRRGALVSLLCLHAASLLSLVSINLLVLALLWVVMIAPSWSLVQYAGPDAGTRRRLGWLVGPMTVSALLLVGIVIVLGTRLPTTSFDLDAITAWGVGGRTQALLFVPFMVALAIRLPLVPFHGWMVRLLEGSPAVAAVPIALTPLGHYLFLRLGLELFGDIIGRHAVTPAVIAVFGMVFCVFVGLAQGSLRSALAYFQLAVSGSLLVGVASTDPMGPTAGLASACNLAIAGTGLLLAADMVHARAGTTDFAALGGLVRTAPRLTGLFLVISLAYAGFPGALGFIAEHLASHGAFEAHGTLAIAMVAAINLASVLLWWSFTRAFLGPWRTPQLSNFPRLLPREHVALLAVVLLVIIAGWWLEPWVAMIEPTIAAHMPRL